MYLKTKDWKRKGSPKLGTGKDLDSQNGGLEKNCVSQNGGMKKNCVSQNGGLEKNLIFCSENNFSFLSFENKIIFQSNF